MRKIISRLLEKRTNETPNRVYLRFREQEEAWKEMTWGEYGKRIERLSRALIGYGIKVGGRVSIIGISSPDWFITDMSIMTIGATTVPIYFTSSAEQIKYILNHSEARILFVDDISYFQRIENSLKDIPGLEKIILIKGSVSEGKSILMDFNTFESMGSDITTEELRHRRDSVHEDMVATFIYTSGTTGDPKAVMLTQKNAYAAAESTAKWEEFITKDKEVKQMKVPCFLTLAHVFDRCSSLLSPMLTGACVYFADLSKAMDELRAIQPTMVVGLPRTWEKAYEQIMAYRDTMAEEEKKIFDWAIHIGMQYNTCLYEKKEIPLSLREEHDKAKTLVINKILDTLGFLKEAKHILTGGAVSSKEVIDFFFALGIWICQVYGQTEAHGIGSVETRDSMRFGSVGKPFAFTEIKIADDGEILVKSDTVSPGYYKDPKLTEETFKDDWLYSGDIGYIDDDGYLFITGRKKEIIITSGAKNITPAKIEASLMGLPLIEHAVVVGDGRKYLTALLTLSMEEGMNFTRKKAVEVKDYKDLFAIEGLEEELNKQIKEVVNKKLSRVEQIKKFKVLPEPLSVETGELTSLMKIRRHVVTEKHTKEIDEMYA